MPVEPKGSRELLHLLDEDCDHSPLSSTVRSRSRDGRGAILLAVLLGATCIIAAGTALFASRLRKTRAVDSHYGAVQLAEQGNPVCHTAVEGEACYGEVQWAKGTGIVSHPEWYDGVCSGLTPESPFEAFQACVYKINQTACGLPCNPKKKISQDAIDATDKEHESHKDKREHEVHKEPCHTAKDEEECYDKVMKVISESGHPEDSTFEQFQASVHKDSDVCPKPCECHTIKKGDEYYKDVVWAKTEGIHAQPGWYPGLTPHSEWEEFQIFIVRHTNFSVPLPCTKVKPLIAREDTSTSTKTSTTRAALANTTTERESKDEEHNETEDEDEAMKAKTTTEKSTSTRTTTEPPTPCHTTREGEYCYENIMEAIGPKKAILEHPSWYPGLSLRSTVEEFQMHNYRWNNETRCPRPCDCQTAQPGDLCYSNIKWVVREGLARHPHWYPGLNATSRFEDVQRRLNEDQHTTCPHPCTTRQWGSPSIFCFSVFQTHGYELPLIKKQLQNNVGIFACDEFATLSDEEVELAEGVTSQKIPLSSLKTGVSKDGTAANTLIFMEAWSVIYNDVRYKTHDWITKVDPDAVLLPERLRATLLPHTGTKSYFKNCDKYHGPGWPMMFGSLEVFSRSAIEAYFDGGAEQCKTKLQWQAWGEDLFMGNCLDMLGVHAIANFKLIGDGVCTGADCGDGIKAAYHPFKSIEKWFTCHKKAVETEKEKENVLVS